MIAGERRNRIKEMLLSKRSVRVSDLVLEFNVSEETIRRDLARLEQEGLIKKNYGGAVLADELNMVMNSVLPIEQRQFQHHEEKDSIGQGAAGLVKPGQVVLLDSGSTTWCVASHLGGIPDLKVVTNGMNVAEECSRNEQTEVFVLGGKLVNKTMSLVGPQALKELRRYTIDLAILGTTGVSLRNGFASKDLYEAEMKRAMVASARTVVVVADHSKFDNQALISFADFDSVNFLVTSSLVDPAILREIELLGPQVIFCAPGFANGCVSSEGSDESDESDRDATTSASSQR